MPDLSSERKRRLDLWHKIANEDLSDIKPQRLRELGIYGGAQGIWVDKTHTASSETGLDGVTVGILHTGHHYADDLSDDGVIYHYPKTSRPPARDATEIQATKNAMTHQLPIFVVLPGKKSQSTRSLKLGWVCDSDDEDRLFLILFGDQNPPKYKPAETANDPFQLKGDANKKQANVKVRTGQQQFRFKVLSQYGSKCAVCDIRFQELLIAAHICGKEDEGSDDWRNGIPLCGTHRDAFDCHFFCIDPTSVEIQCKLGIKPSDIGLHQKKLKTLKGATPHITALKWRWDLAQRVWKGH
jgi:hypothetical protein